MTSWFPAFAAGSAMLAALLAVASAPSGSAAAAAPRKLSSYDAQARALLGTMTLDEKIGQMVQAEQDKLTDEKDIETYFLGSLLSGGDSDPRTNSLQDWTDMYDRYQSRALKTRLKIPLLYGVDAVHGHHNVIGAVVFPHHIGLGATRDAKLVQEIGRVTAEEVRATGIQWAFAPCVAVVRDERWGRTYESFAEEPTLVAELGEAEVAGLQGDDLKDRLRGLACAKPYVGDDGTAFASSTLATCGNRAGGGEAAGPRVGGARVGHGRVTFARGRAGGRRSPLGGREPRAPFGPPGPRPLAGRAVRGAPGLRETGGQGLPRSKAANPIVV